MENLGTFRYLGSLCKQKSAYLYMMNESVFFNKYERDPIQLKDARIAEYYGLVHDPEPKVRYIINKYESNPAAADIDDDDDKSDGNTPNVQYVIEQPFEASYMEVSRYYDRDATPKSFDKSVTFNDRSPMNNDKIVLIPDPSDPTRSTEGHTLHRLKTAEEPSKFPTIITPKKKGGSKKRRKGSRKSNSKTRSKRGGAKSKKEAELCPICLDELKKGEQIPKLNCKHKFHKACLELVCRKKNNVDVPCPLCRGDITFSCVADITRASPWKYNPYTDSTPFDVTAYRNMSAEERRKMDKEIQKHHRNWLARRRRTIRKETPEQRTLRIETETRLNHEMETARNRHFTRGPESPPSPHSPVYNPNSPDYPPSPRFSPHTPDSPA